MEKSEKLDPTFVNLHGKLPANKISSSLNFIFFTILLFGTFLIFRIQNTFMKENFYLPKSKRRHTNITVKFPLNCTNENAAKTCKKVIYPSFDLEESSDTICPDYFRWIHEDLRPWKNTGISRDTLESAKNFSHFRLVILNGRAYLEKYQPSYQTRDLFTIWGIVQLLRLYPSKVPDLELMFRCGDIPLIKKEDYEGPNTTSLVPPVLFQYCSRNSAYAVVFPDWSFWGWPEVNIEPWGKMLKGIIEGSKKLKWKKRAPYAFWKGNPYVDPNREDLMKCNLTDEYDWDARLYLQVKLLFLSLIMAHSIRDEERGSMHGEGCISSTGTYLGKDSFGKFSAFK
ncbi:hypothetical protein M5689_004907 [Euphorbia peplus]|nr:hypothetical protein M5689_004907 [Euphorbia peplus]